MKRFIFSGLVLSFLFFNYSNFFLPTANAENCFVVSAYYSPLPDQKYYYRGSYEADVRLNGRGVHGASGKEVFSGMLAAPKKYPFGTKIYLEGFGVGEVADRGGAIVSTDFHEDRGYEYDRIDIWMGYGEAGLARALRVGKKTVCNSEVLDENSLITIDITQFNGMNLASKMEKKQVVSVFNTDIGPSSPLVEVALLHTFLHEQGFYNGVIESKYNKDTIVGVYTFQIKNNLVTSPKTNGAGVWGEQTRNQAKAIVMLQEKQQMLLAESPILTQSGTQEKIFETYLTPTSSSQDIVALQKIFASMNLYTGALNGSYTDLKAVLVPYQIKEKIIASAQDPASGYFGPRTREKLKSDYDTWQETQRTLAKEKQKQEALLLQIEKDVQKKVDEHLTQIGSPKMGEKGESVRVLQKTLKILGYFQEKDTGVFGPKTKEALIAYQLKKNIIKSTKESDAGIFGPKTRANLKIDLELALKDLKLKEQNLLVYKPN